MCETQIRRTLDSLEVWAVTVSKGVWLGSGAFIVARQLVASYERIDV